ncbi:Ubiquinone/menaquinone biosynthesis C-methylase UbiE [Haladaptatus litoreus]|uniref:Arsenite methyltransferase n=1 Tax=Haladaptatus litoreus TaxID=553468 RepID=A0A1N7CMK4_9EURY|nr:arsenite methyltransferase [Haladaptatus litoreus]SIR64836.1 Ubiquinone/menaquinone biosynthesis C-methylase UbiE [Haladaptatus litoreus]
MSNTSNSKNDDAETIDAETRRRAVRERYASIATDDTGCCDDSLACCDDTALDDRAEQLGYTADERDSVSSGANLGLGCGNPNAIASLDTEETVLDLGSGGGFDCFLAADEVGPDGRVIGVDMTPEMVERARTNVEKNDVDNVEFRLGEIEHLPVADDSADVVISNCVINLSPDKPQVFQEAYRVLRPDGRLAISDIVMTAPLPADARNDLDSLTGCVAGATTIESLRTMLDDAGFEDIHIEPKEESDQFIREWDDSHDVSEYVVSATIEGHKPAR